MIQSGGECLGGLYERNHQDTKAPRRSGRHIVAVDRLNPVPEASRHAKKWNVGSTEEEKVKMQKSKRGIGGKEHMPPFPGFAF